MRNAQAKYYQKIMSNQELKAARNARKRELYQIQKEKTKQELKQKQEEEAKNKNNKN
tara:strand:- start:588 stop:758 length:171 start_codon:yes stop_codon:yes gene_type:complete